MGNWKTPDDLLYAKSDEWLRVEGDTATMGITDYAQDALNDLVYVEFKDQGDRLNKGQSFGELESVKAASNLYVPVDCEILEVNLALKDAPETINSDPYGAGWMVKIKILNSAGLSDLMKADAYAAYCESR